MVSEILLLIGLYLFNKKQYLTLSGHTSECQDLSCGVLQGSVFGPLLFLIHINGLPKKKNLRYSLFVDDTNIYFDAKDVETLQKNELWMKPVLLHRKSNQGHYFQWTNCSFFTFILGFQDT